MMMIIFYMFVVQPLVEYGAHMCLHVFKERNHTRHHKQGYDDVGYELWAVVTMCVCAYFRLYVLSLGVLKYYVVHQTIHRWPWVFPALHENHVRHHMDSRGHYGISLAAICDRSASFMSMDRWRVSGSISRLWHSISSSRVFLLPSDTLDTSNLH